MEKLNVLSDKMLVSLYINGNNEAFDVLLNRYQSNIFQYILNFSKNKQDAEDIFQDVFVKIIMNLRDGNYVEVGKFLPWAIRIAKNLMLDTARYKNNRPQTVSHDNIEKDNYNLYNKAVYENGETELINNETESVAKVLISRLPENQQEIVRMRIHNELSFKEIASKLGISINTALGRMRYAEQNLHKMAIPYEFSA